MRYSLPYGKSNVVFEAPEEQIIFTGEMRAIPELNDIEAALIQAMDNPIGAKPLRLLAKGKKNIVFLVEDGTRDTPLSIMMPVITDYLNRHGIPDDAMSFLTAPGTHRIMTEGEIIEKLGGDMVRRFAVRQHDANIPSDMRDLGTVNAGD
ncbi:MAG: lactate racemase domain-containing protein [Cloacibacillus evryensis]